MSYERTALKFLLYFYYILSADNDKYNSVNRIQPGLIIGRNATVVSLVVSAAQLGSKMFVFLFIISFIRFLGSSIPYFRIKTPTRADNWSKRNGGLSSCIRCLDQFPRLRGTAILPSCGNTRILGLPKKTENLIPKHGNTSIKKQIQK